MTCEGSVDAGVGGVFSVTSLPNGLGFVVATTAAALFLVAPPTSSASQV